MHLHRLSSACGSCCVCFVLDPVSVHGPKTKHTQQLPQADERRCRLVTHSFYHFAFGLLTSIISVNISQGFKVTWTSFMNAPLSHPSWTYHGGHIRRRQHEFHSLPDPLLATWFHAVGPQPELFSILVTSRLCLCFQFHNLTPWMWSWLPNKSACWRK